MSMDLILHAPDKTTLLDFAKANGLFVRRGVITDDDPESPTFGQVIDPGEWVRREGFDYCWWAGSGKMMRTLGTYDAEGVELTPTAFFPGVVALLRIYGDFFNTDRLDDAVDEEQWSRSKIVRYIKNNGALGSTLGISYYELDGVKIFRPGDVNAMLADRGVPGHEWLGGNSY